MARRTKRRSNPAPEAPWLEIQLREVLESKRRKGVRSKVYGGVDGILWFDARNAQPNEDGYAEMRGAKLRWEWGPGRMYKHLHFTIGSAFVNMGPGARRTGENPMVIGETISVPSPEADGSIDLSDNQLRKIGMEGYLLLPQMIERLAELMSASQSRRS